jgi:hypothetical protein
LAEGDAVPSLDAGSYGNGVTEPAAVAAALTLTSVVAFQPFDASLVYAPAADEDAGEVFSVRVKVEISVIVTVDDNVCVR